MNIETEKYSFQNKHIGYVVFNTVKDYDNYSDRIAKQYIKSIKEQRACSYDKTKISRNYFI